MTTRYTPPDPGWTAHHFVDDTGMGKATDAGIYEIEEANEYINALIKDGEIEEALAMAEANRRLIGLAPEMGDFVERVAEHFADTDAPLGLEAVALLARLEDQS